MRVLHGRGPDANAMFLAAAAEGLPGFLTEAASLVTITMPWGSLLRGVLGLDQTALHGVASVVAPGGRVEILASVVAADHVDGVDALDRSAGAVVGRAWRPLGFELESIRPGPRTTSAPPGRHGQGASATAPSGASISGGTVGLVRGRRSGRHHPIATIIPLDWNYRGIDSERDVLPTATSRSSPRWATLAPYDFDPSAPIHDRPPAEDLRTWPR